MHACITLKVLVASLVNLPCQSRVPPHMLHNKHSGCSFYQSSFSESGMGMADEGYQLSVHGTPLTCRSSHAGVIYDDYEFCLYCLYL